MTPEEKDAFLHRRRARNIALLAVLLAFVVLIYLIGVARFPLPNR